MGAKVLKNRKKRHFSCCTTPTEMVGVTILREERRAETLVEVSCNPASLWGLANDSREENTTSSVNLVNKNKTGPPL